MEIYQTKEKDYFSNVRLDLIQFLPQNAQQRLLEIGAGSGATLHYIKENNLAQEVVGVELCHIENSFQQHEYIDRLIIANIENDVVDLPQNYFDVLICGDVLEHLIDPWKTLQMLTTYLKPNGLLILSIPNIREIETLYKIIFQADFRYENAGILDKTHLRFFCKKNVQDLVKGANLNIKAVHHNFLVVKEGKKRKLLNLLTLGLFKDFFCFSVYCISPKIKYAT